MNRGGQADPGPGGFPEGHPDAQRPPRLPHLRARWPIQHRHYDSLIGEINKLKHLVGRVASEQAQAIMARDQYRDDLVADLTLRVDGFEHRIAEIAATDSIAAVGDIRGELDGVRSEVETLRYEVARREERLDELFGLLADVSGSFASAALRFRARS
jgi:hypothetical protein